MSTKDPAVVASKRSAYLVPVVITIVLAVAFFVPAWSLRFWQAWIYLAVFSSLTFFIAAYFLKRDPAFLSRRMQFKEQATTRKPPAWLNLFFLGFLVPGFDFHFHWSGVPLWLVIAGNVAVFLGYLFVILVFRENSYASATIQVEKAQPVISTGPYAYVRHPMYTGLLVMFLCTPFALGSCWALLPFLLSIPMNVLRIRSEEEVLLRDFPGYKEYCATVRYRLVPWVW
jgi:protein-S-isoprenylcysteine O-methyltransferase Ste14